MDQVRDAVPGDGDHDGNDDARAPAYAPLTAGARLRAAREALGMTTADIAARTRITLRHVDALDRGDLASLPGRPYVLGFVRNYARVVGLDEAELAALARSEIDRDYAPPKAQVVHQFDVDDPAKTPSRLVTWLALVLFVLVLAAGGVFWRSYYAPGTDLPSLAEPDPAPQPAPRPSQAVTAPPAVPTGPVAPLSDHRGVVRDVPVSAQALLARGQPGFAAPIASPAVTRRRANRAATDDSSAPSAAPSPPAAPVVAPSPPAAPVAAPAPAPTTTP